MPPRRSRTGDVASRNEVHALDRHKKLRLVRVDEQHELTLDAAAVERLQRLETPEAVIDVDHIVAGLKVAKVGNEGAEVALFRFGSISGSRSVGLLRFAEDVDLGVN